MVSIFDMDIPLRDRVLQALNDKVEVFPLYKAEDVKMPCVQIVRESADLLPNSGSTPLYDCSVHFLCYSYEYGESVLMASRVMSAFNRVCLRYADDDGSALIVNCVKVGAGSESVSETGAMVQEVALQCRTEVVPPATAE